MPQIEEAKVQSVDASRDPVERRKGGESRPEGKEEPRSRWPMVGILVLASTVILIGVLIWLGTLLMTGLHRGQAILEGINDSTALMAEETRAMQEEVAELRHYLASASAENVIYLKMMMLAPDLDPALGAEIAMLVHRYAKLYGHDPDLILSIMYVESKFNPNAVSSKGATGLMQIMPLWKKVLGIKEELTDPETSIKYGLQILGFYREMYKDVETALIAYNRGPGPVDLALMKGRDPNNGYPDKVIETYDQLRNLNIRAL